MKYEDSIWDTTVMRVGFRARLFRFLFPAIYQDFCMAVEELDISESRIAFSEKDNAVLRTCISDISERVEVDNGVLSVAEAALTEAKREIESLEAKIQEMVDDERRIVETMNRKSEEVQKARKYVEEAQAESASARKDARDSIAQANRREAEHKKEVAELGRHCQTYSRASSESNRKMNELEKLAFEQDARVLQAIELLSAYRLSARPDIDVPF